MFSKILVDDKVTEIKYVYHISDIHIRKISRHEEYLEVFERLYDMIDKMTKDSSNESIIVITGDIVDSKTDMTPELFCILSDFFERISKKLYVILIAGNHDCNLSNNDRMDALTPIFKKNKKLKSRIYYLKKTGFYQYYNILFGFTFTGEKEILNDGMIPDELFDCIKQKSKYKIALYHGTIRGSKTDLGFEISSVRIRGKDFRHYDYGFFGDIHCYQYLNNEKTLAYPGSLIQQNFGEKIDNHGILHWNLHSGKSKLINIPNDYGFCHIVVSNGKLTFNKNTINDVIVPNKPRIKLILEDTTEERYQEIVKTIREKFTYCEIIKEHKKVKMIKDIIKVSKKNNYEKYLSQYILSKKLPKNISKNDILKLHKNICDIVQQKLPQSFKGKQWEFIQLKFSNMFSYGEKNVIRFKEEDMGVIGIVAPNHYGKSAIMDILLYCLFEKTSRGDPREIMKNGKEEMKCSLQFIIDNVKYKITRTAVKKTNNIRAKLTVNFVKYVDNVKKSLNGTTKVETNSIITQYIGSYNDHLTTYICVQDSSNQKNLAKKPEKEKKDFLYEILGLNIFEEAYKYGKDEIKKLSILLTEKKSLLSKIPLDDYIKNKNNSQTKLKKLLSDNKNHNELLHILLSYRSNKKELYKFAELNEFKLHNKEDINIAISQLKNKINNLAIIDIDKELATLKKKLSLLNNHDYDAQIDIYNQKIKKQYEKKNKILYNGPNEKELNNQKIKLTNQLKKNKSEILEVKEILSNEKNFSITDEKWINEKINLIQSHIDFLCLINKQLNKSLTKLINDKISDYTSEISKCAKIKDGDSYDKNDLGHKLNKLILNKKLIKKNLEQVEKEIEQCINWKSSVVQNNKINAFIYKYENEIVSLKKSKEKNSRIIDKINSRIKELESSLGSHDELINKLSKLKIYKLNYFDYSISEQKNSNDEKNILELREKIAGNNLLIERIKCEINSIDDHIQNYNNLKLEEESMTKKLAIFTYYTNMVNTHGIPYDILKSMFPIFESEINNTLLNISNFTMEILYYGKDGKKDKKATAQEISNIGFNICRNYNKSCVKYPVSLASGYESFIAGLAIRIALSNLSITSKPNFFFIDEGWSSMDAENLANVKNIFEFLSTKFNYVIIISHLSEIANLMKKIIKIDKKDNNSIVNYV